VLVANRDGQKSENELSVFLKMINFSDWVQGKNKEPILGKDLLWTCVLVSY